MANSDTELIAKLKALDKTAWDSWDYAHDKQYSEEQKNIICHEKNLFFQKWYQNHPDGEETEDQPQKEFTSPEVETAYNRHIAELKAQQAEYMAKVNPSFVFYSSFYESLEDMHGETFESHVRALCEYGLYGKTDNYKGSVKMFMTQAIPQLDANQRRRITAKINGLQGGAREGNGNAKKNKQPKTT